MAGHQYIQSGGNLFGDDEEIDDETFLKSGRSNSSNSNYIDQQQLSYEQRKIEIENRTLSSAKRSLGILHETEHVGIATAEELAKQREQLENTNKQLDDINTTLRFSQKHLNGLKSIFGGLKNYVYGQQDNSSTAGRRTSGGETSNQSFSGYQHTASGQQNVTTNPFLANEELPRWNSSARITSEIEQRNAMYSSQSSVYPPQKQYQQQQQQQQKQQYQPSSFNQQLDSNLDDMAGSLSRLKNLALDLNQDIESQNDLIDDITNKVDTVDVKIQRQNKDIKNLLKK